MNKLKISLLTLGLMVAGVAGAALLTTYGTSEGTVAVSQAVTFDELGEQTTHTFPVGDVVAGNTYKESFDLYNRSASLADIKLLTTSDDVVGMTVTYWQHTTGGLIEVTNVASIALPMGLTLFEIQVETVHALTPSDYIITTSVNPVQ